jgi:20S proteasome alpha/beta subunit
MIIACRPHFHIKPTRLQSRADMTIAAGILCSDGIIVCADTEHSDEVRKFQAAKIHTIEDHTFLTGAGTTDYILMAVEKLRDQLKCARPQNISDARDMIENLVHELYSRHIFSFYEASDPYRPQIHLIVGMRCMDENLALIRTNDSAAILSQNFEVTGTGSPIFDYWCRYFYRDRLTMEGMALLALFMLKEVKKVHPSCGGTSHVFYLPRVRSELRGSRFFDDEHLLLGFPDNIVKILSACLYTDTPGEWIEQMLHEFATGVRALHQGEKFRSQIVPPGWTKRDISTQSDPET